MAETARRLLALDGGGIRGVLAIEVLAAIEDRLRTREKKPDLVLADFFDYIAGTSTGAILAAGLSAGMSVGDLRKFYHEEADRMFTRASLLDRLRYAYDAEPLAKRLQEVFHDMTLGSPKLRTYLMLVLRNATTDSAWPLSNNPFAKYNVRSPERESNLDLPLWQLVRASTAAPTYFPPEVIHVGKAKPFAFVDGGVTTDNNPAFLLFLLATLAPYNLAWPTGEHDMLLVSVGTGRSPADRPDLSADGDYLLRSAMTIPMALMSSSAAQQDLLCRAFGRCRAGLVLDRELGDLVDLAQYDAANVPGSSAPKLFTYVRYDADLTLEGMHELGLALDPSALRKLDAVAAVKDLADVGEAVGRKRVLGEHFSKFTVRSSPSGPNATELPFVD